MMEKTIDATSLLMDRDIERILIATHRKPMSAQELSQTFGIPTSLCFRKVKELRKMGLLELHGTELSNSGRKIKRYAASLENAYVYYDNGRLRVRFKVVLQMANDFRKRYEDFTEIPIQEG